MFRIPRKFVESCLLILLLLTVFLLASLSATAQESTNSQVVQDKVARKATVEETDRTLPMSANARLLAY